MMRSTDDVTPQSALTYEVFANGRYVGSLTDQPQNSGAWGVLRLTRTGPNRITVEAVDEAGNRSVSRNAPVVRGSPC